MARCLPSEAGKTSQSRKNAHVTSRMSPPVELPAVKMAAVAAQMAAAKISDEPAPPASKSSQLAKQDLATTVRLNNLTARSKENQLKTTADTRKQSLTRLRKAAAPVLEQSRDKALARRSSAAAMPTARRGSAAGMLVAQPAKTDRPLAGSSLSNQSGQSEGGSTADATPSQTPDRTPASKWRVAVTAVAATVPEKPALKYGNIAFDMAGQMHDIAALRERRNAAVTKGMIFMHKFFKKNDYAALHEIGDDAPSIFFECWYTSANSTIRMHAKEIFKQLYPIFETRLLQLSSGPDCSPPPTPQLAAAAVPAPSRRRRKSSVGLAAVPVVAIARLKVKAKRDAEATPQAAKAAPEAATHAAATAAAAAVATAPAEATGAAVAAAAAAATVVSSLDEAQDAGPAAVRHAAAAKLRLAAAAAAAAGAEGGEAEGGESGGGSSLQDAQDAGPAAVRRRNQARAPGTGGAASSSGAAEGGDAEGGGGSAYVPPAARAAAAAAAERPDREDFFAFMFLARCKHEMGEDDEASSRSGGGGSGRSSSSNSSSSSD